MSNDDDDNYKEPALKHFSRPAFMAKNTVMETLKGALTGALIGAAIFAALVVALPIVVAFIPGFGPLAAGAMALLGVSTGLGASVLAGAAIHGAMIGGGLGAVTKGALSLGGASEAADDEEMRLITKAQQSDMRQQRVAARADEAPQRSDGCGAAAAQSVGHGAVGGVSDMGGVLGEHSAAIAGCGLLPGLAAMRLRP